MSELVRIQVDEVTGEALYSGIWYECYDDAFNAYVQDLEDHIDHQDDVRDDRRDEER